MYSTSLVFASQKINGYKRGIRSKLSTFIPLQMANQYKRRFISLPITLIFLCSIQARNGKKDHRPWNSTNWVSVGQNDSGIEWWKVGSMMPRLYSWQANHGNRGAPYTKKPKPNPKFGSGTLPGSPKFGDPDSFPPGINKTVAQKVARKLESASHTAFTTKLPTSSNLVNLVEEPRSKPGFASFKSSTLTQKAFRIPPRDHKAELKKLSLPVIPHRVPKPYHLFQDAGTPLLTKVNATTLSSESNRRYAEQRSLREHRQKTPDAITELNLTQDQLRDLKARVNRRFLVEYDCSKPADVKPVSSFIRDPCEPVEANSWDNYEIQKVTQFQIVQYETRREFMGTRCERYISQFTYYCGNADHASPLPQETFFRRPKVLAQNECRAMEMGQYHAGNAKMYSIARNV